MKQSSSKRKIGKGEKKQPLVLLLTLGGRKSSRITKNEKNTKAKECAFDSDSMLGPIRH